MTVTDLARFGYEHVRMAHGRSALLKRETAKMLHEGGGKDYSLGWNRQSFRGGPLLLHTGSNGFWFALLMVAPEAGWSLAVTTNGGRSLGGEQAVLTAAGRLAALASG
jgi:hypothetical protein